LPSSLRKPWLITPPGAPSHFSGSAVSHIRGVPYAPRRGARCGPGEGSRCLSLMVREPGSSLTSIQEGSQHASDLLGADRPRLAVLGRSQTRSRDLILDRVSRRVRKAAVQIVDWAAGKIGNRSVGRHGLHRFSPVPGFIVLYGEQFYSRLYGFFAFSIYGSTSAARKPIVFFASSATSSRC
jgi:hypothetical protein